MERHYLNMSGSVTYEKWTEMFHDERHFHWVRSARIWSFSGPHFPSIGMKTYSLRMRIGTDQKKIEYGHSLRSVYFKRAFCVTAVRVAPHFLLSLSGVLRYHKWLWAAFTSWQVKIFTGILSITLRFTSINISFMIIVICFTIKKHSNIYT